MTSKIEESYSEKHPAVAVRMIRHGHLIKMKSLIRVLCDKLFFLQIKYIILCSTKIGVGLQILIIKPTRSTNFSNLFLE